MPVYKTASAHVSTRASRLPGLEQTGNRTLHRSKRMDNLAPKTIENAVIERAKASDVPCIKSIVEAAYSKYIERMGKLPAPMAADYNKLFEAYDVYVLKVNDEVIGSIILSIETDSIAVNNLVLDPLAQGRGYGRVLMNHAEDVALERGLTAITLYTNEKMYENIALYKKLGFSETGRRREDGFDRVFFRRSLV